MLDWKGSGSDPSLTLGSSDPRGEGSTGMRFLGRPQHPFLETPRSEHALAASAAGCLLPISAGLAGRGRCLPAGI